MASITDIPWPDRKRGDGCPFCGARADESEAWSKVIKLSVSSLYLQKAQTYRGYCVLVLDLRHATRLTELSNEEWIALSSDIGVAQRAIERVTKPDHFNVASLGNIVPHLHWHIIPRYENDSRWGAPIWTTREDEMQIVRLSEEEHRNLVEAIRAECD